MDAPRHASVQERGGKALWLPLLAGLLLCSLAAMLWSTFSALERKHLQEKVQIEAEDASDHVYAELRSRIPALQRMARRWAIRGGTPWNEFLSDATSFMVDLPGFQALEWVDESYVVRWVVPLAGNEQALGLNLAFEPRRRAALEEAKAQGVSTMTSPVDLVQGGKGVLVYVPIFEGKDFRGFILAVVQAEEWLGYVFNVSEFHPSKDFRISVSFDGIPVFRQDGWVGSPKAKFEASSEASLIGHRFSVSVQPTQDFIEKNRTPLPAISAAFGGLLSILVAYVIRLLQKVSLEAGAANKAKKALEEEILEHRRAEEELEHTLSRLDMATKSGGIGVWTLDVATGLLSWNERMYELFGIPQDAFLTYDTWRSSLHPEDRASAESLLRDTIEGKAEFQTDFRVLAKDGSVRQIGASARVVRDPEGKALLVTGINWDLTERKATEEALRRNEERMRLLLNSTAEAIYGIDLEGRCTFANPSCARMLGYKGTDSFLGRNMHELIHHSWADGRRMPQEDCSIYRAIREAAEVHRWDEVLWRSDGTSFPAEYWSYPALVDGKAVGAVVTFTDITERRRNEEALAEATRELESRVEERTRSLTEAHARIMEQRLLQSDLELAGQVQFNLTPRIHPLLEGFDFAARALPSRFLNGDFFEYEVLGRDCFTILLADIAGKGLSAALLASSARSLYRRILADEGGGRAATPPGEILRELNREMLHDLEIAERFITMLAARLDMETGRLEIANAGGCKVVVFDSINGTSKALDIGGIPVGVFPDFLCESATLDLRPGMGILLYSDGVTEAANPAGELFGFARVLDIAARDSRHDAETMASEILSEVEAFQEGLPISDDVTLLVLKAKPRRICFDFLTSLESLDEMPARIASACSSYGEPMARDLELAVSELLANLRLHGYKSREGPVSMDLRLETRGVEILVREKGRAFDPKDVPAPGLGEAVEGGFGLYLIRRVMDIVSYQPGGADGNLWILFRSVKAGDA